jgi:outer membrane lipoprotein-sorting protein
VEVDPRNFMIHRLVFRYVDDQVNEFRFKNITTSPVDPARFKCDVPPGVELIEE